MIDQAAASVLGLCIEDKIQPSGTYSLERLLHPEGQIKRLSSNLLARKGADSLYATDDYIMNTTLRVMLLEVGKVL